MFNAKSRRFGMGDDRTAALFSGPELRGANSLAAFVRRTRPDAVAGHGFGDLAALVAADALDLRVAIELAHMRDELVADANGDVEGGLLAVLDIDADSCARKLCALSGARIARYDSPSRVVLAGSKDELRFARQAAAELYVTVDDVPAPGALHSSAMASAARRFNLVLTEVGFRPPAITVYSAVTGEPMFCPIEELSRSLEAPVLWTKTILALGAAGTTRYVEADSDRALGDLVLESLSGPQVAVVTSHLVSAGATLPAG